MSDDETEVAETQAANDTLGGACDMCSPTLAVYREDVTFWWAA
jgi:hypothetical protein